MSKRNTLLLFTLWASTFAMICLLASVITAQKGTNTVSGAPLKGVDVKLGKNPGGGAAARTGSTDEKGQVNWGPLEPGNYSLTIVALPKQQNAADAEAYSYLIVEIKGGSVDGGTRRMAFDVKKQKFVSPQNNNATAKSKPPGDKDSIDFKVNSGPPLPCETTIIRSKSNITNN